MIKEVEKERGERNIERGWWEEECRMTKREVRKELKEWRRNGREEREYRKKEKNIGNCVRGKRFD